MPSVESFLKTNAQKLDLLKWFILPILVAALFFFLDGRYISRDDWKSQNSEQKTIIVNLSNDQKEAFTHLTKAITALTDEQRNTAEYQRSNAAAIAATISSFEKHEMAEIIKWEKSALIFEKLDSRLNKLETDVAKHDVAIQLNLNYIKSHAAKE